jgi:alpha-tubulin suppressor-like RCC1 family protein
LKELRDQLVGRRCGNGIVFTWGIANYGRLGIPLNNEQMKVINSENHDLLALKPSVVKFPEPTIIIYKVSCGSSFSLAMSTEGNVYSWGLGNSGGLGLGEVSMSFTP